MTVLAFPMGRKIYAFSAFTFEPDSGILQRNGRQIRMPPQTSLLLSILLERAGTVVSREEIQRLLWPGGEYLDHEQAINRAVNSLRMVLRDDARKSRFIETFSKRGYRFTATVTRAFPPPGTSWDGAEQPRLVASSDGSLRITRIAESEPEPETETEPETEAEEADYELEAEPSHEQAYSILPAAPAAEKSRARLRLLIAAGVLLLICVLAAIVTLYKVRHRQPEAPSMIVLGIAPFEADGSGAEELAESFRLELMDSLSQLPRVQLRGSHSLQALARGADTAALARGLNLDMLLLGKVSVRGDTCLLQFELVRAADSVHIASYQYSGTREELATIRDKVQRDVFSTLQASHKPIQEFHGSTQNPAAYGEYLLARAGVYERTRKSVSEALRAYASAIAHDPGFARAYAGMATAHVVNHNFTNSPDDQAQAQASAQRALALDPNLAEAYAALGVVFFRRDWNLTLGEAALRKALEIEPHQAMYHAWLAQLLAVKGEFAESLRQIDLAHSDDPLWPQVYNIEGPVAGAARDYARAIQASRRYVELSHDSPLAHDELAWAYFEAGRYEDAIASWRAMAVLEVSPQRVAFEDQALRAFQSGGLPALASMRLAASIIPGNPVITGHENDFVPAEWYAFTGDKDRALAGLEQETPADLQEMQPAINPMLDSLHSDPRFLRLLAGLHLKLPASYSHTD